MQAVHSLGGRKEIRPWVGDLGSGKIMIISTVFIHKDEEICPGWETKNVQLKMENPGVNSQQCEGSEWRAGKTTVNFLTKVFRLFQEMEGKEERQGGPRKQTTAGGGVRPLLLLLSHFSCVQLCATPWTAAHQAPPSLGFSRQEHWSGLPFPSPMHESEKWTVTTVMKLKDICSLERKLWQT